MAKKNKQSKSKKLNYLKAVVIVHGKSELQMCEFIKNNLRIKMGFISNNKRKSSIQISGLLKRLNGKDIKGFNSFRKKYEDDIEIIDKKLLSNNFKIFTIMDTDDCSDEQRNNYKNKTMFKKHWAYDYICPIYNDSNLEEVLIKSDMKYKSKDSKEMKKEYIEIFPTDEKYIKSDTIQIEEFYQKLLKVKNISNMHEFIKFCLENKSEFSR